MNDITSTSNINKTQQDSQLTLSCACSSYNILRVLLIPILLVLIYYTVTAPTNKDCVLIVNSY